MKKLLIGIVVAAFIMSLAGIASAKYTSNPYPGPVVVDIDWECDGHFGGTILDDWKACPPDWHCFEEIPTCDGGCNLPNFDSHLKGNLWAGVDDFTITIDKDTFINRDYTMGGCGVLYNYDETLDDYTSVGWDYAEVQIYPNLDFNDCCTCLEDRADWQEFKADAMVFVGLVDYSDVHQYQVEYTGLSYNSDTTLMAGTMVAGIGAFGIESVVYSTGVYAYDE